LGIQVPPPRFGYSIQKKSLKIILVLDISQAMNVESRWVRTRDALFRFVSHMPTGAELGIITVGEHGANVNIDPTVVRQSNREGLHGRIPYRLLNDREACLSCGIKKAKELLGDDESSDQRSIVVVSANREKIIIKPNNADAIPIHQVFFDEQDLFANNSTQAIVEEIGQEQHPGSVFRVPNTTRLLQSLSAIFLSVLKLANGPHIECTYQRYYHFEPSNINNDIIEDSYEVVSGNSLDGTFTVEKELSTDLWVVLTPSPGFEEDIEVFEITSPSGRKYVFPKYDHGVVYFHFEAQNNEAGVWTFEARMHPIVTKTLGSVVSLEVFGQQSSTGNAVTLDFWTAPSGDKTTKILYARVSQDDLPIQDANVEAFIYPPSMDGRPMKVKLEDTGTGYPDITQGDGVYSAYLVLQYPGYFRAQVKANFNGGKANLPKPYGNEKLGLNCCGSKLPEYYNIPTSPFERVIAGQSFTNERIASPDNPGWNRKDQFPPSRITDLHIKSYVNKSLYATLEWTAPGDDFNIGTAFIYEMRCYTNPDTLMSSQFLNKAIPVHESLLPSPGVSGTLQTITVALPWPNEVFYYAITSLDESNNRAQVSNLVPVYAEEIKTTTHHEMTFKVVNSSNNDHLITGQYGHLEAMLDNDTMIYVISGGITAFLLVLIGLFSLAMCRAKRKRALKQRPPPPITGNEHHQTEANIYVVNGSNNNNNTEQPLSSVTTTTSVLPDLTNDHLHPQNKTAFDVWKMDSLMESGYINTYYRGGSTHNNYPSLQAFPASTTPHNVGPMSLLSLNISHNPKLHQMTSSHSQTNLSALRSSQLPLQIFR
jgi:hypothetical protein